MIKAEKILAKIYQDLIWHFTGKENHLFLTFDDGPTPEVTPWVLDLLAEYDAKGTFFCIGEKVKQYPGLYERILKEGHSVGNHTYDHLKGWTVSPNTYMQSIKKASEFIDSNLFRPPYGKILPVQIKSLKDDFKIVMWDVLSKDYDQRISPEKCYNTVVDYAQSGSIIVFHDSLKAEKNLQYCLPKVLEYFAEKGFSFPAIECSLSNVNS